MLPCLVASVEFSRLEITRNAEGQKIGFKLIQKNIKHEFLIKPNYLI